MRHLLAALAFLVLLSGSANAQGGMKPGPGTPHSAAAYSGPGDVLSGATAWYGLRGYSSAYAATGTGKAIKVRRVSDNTTSDVVILTNGKLDVAGAASFAGTDATGTCSTPGLDVALNCTGMSSTPHVGDIISGTGVSAPLAAIFSCGAFSGGAGSCVLYTAQNISSTTITFQTGLYIDTAYDQSGASACSGACDLVQATTATQLLLIPNCLNGQPCWAANGDISVATTMRSSSALASALATQPIFHSFVAERTVFVSYASTINCGDSTNTTGAVQSGFSTTASNVLLFAGTVVSVSGAADSAPHAVQELYNTTSSAVNIDGTDTTGLSPGSGTCASGSNFIWMPTGVGNSFSGFMSEAGMWGTAPNSTVRGNMHANQAAFWGTP